MTFRTDALFQKQNKIFFQKLIFLILASSTINKYTANQILLTLGKEYRNQLKQIKKISSKLPINHKKELNFEAGYHHL